MKPFWRGFFSVWMYAGAFLIGAPLWMKDWDRGIRRMIDHLD